METRDAVGAAMAASGAIGTALSVGFLTGSAWWGLLVGSVVLVVAGVFLLVVSPDVVAVPEPADDSPTETFRTAATTLGVPLEESRQGVVPKVGHPIGQLPDYYGYDTSTEADPVVDALKRGVRR